jgi:hypothetical protein
MNIYRLQPIQDVAHFSQGGQVHWLTKRFHDVLENPSLQEISVPIRDQVYSREGFAKGGKVPRQKQKQKQRQTQIVHIHNAPPPRRRRTVRKQTSKKPFPFNCHLNSHQCPADTSTAPSRNHNRSHKQSIH